MKRILLGIIVAAVMLTGCNEQDEQPSTRMQYSSFSTPCKNGISAIAYANGRGFIACNGSNLVWQTEGHPTQQ